MQDAFKTGVLTLSDKGSQGKREDESGRVAVKILEGEGFSVVKRAIIPDNRQRIAETLAEWVDHEGLSLIVTTGGTGLRDRKSVV